MQCPITLHEISNPVAFASLESQPYELHALCDWLELSCRNPLTGGAACVGDLVPLGSDEQRRVGWEMLERRGVAAAGNQVMCGYNQVMWLYLWFMCYRLFKVSSRKSRMI